MAWAGAVQSVDGRGLGKAVDISASNWAVATHDSHVHIFDIETGSTIHSWNEADTITSARLSEDDGTLFIGLESEWEDSPSLILYDTETWEQELVIEDGSEVDRISFDDDGTLVASQNWNNGVTIWNVSTGDVLRTFDNRHTTDVRCVSLHPSGQLLLTGEFEGDVVLWNTTDGTILDEWAAGSGLTDCAFNPSGTLMTWAAKDNLFIRNVDATFSFNQIKTTSSHIDRLAFSPDGTTLNLLLSSRIIDVLTIEDGGEWPRTNRYDIGHLAFDFAINPNGDQLLVATGGNLVSLFRSSSTSLDVQPGLDFDQDGIPDDVDTDDDGDGIPDDVDNLCDAGSNCHMSPDIEKIRNIRIGVNGRDVTITETVQFTPTQSVQLRILGAKVLTGDHTVDVNEARELSDMLCSSHDDADILGRWNSALELEGQRIETATVACTAMPGLKSTTNTDRANRVTLTWTIQATLLVPLEAPYNVSLVAGLPTPSNSPAKIVPQFPVHLVIDDASGGHHIIPVWDRDGTDLLVMIQAPPAPEPTSLESAINALVAHWYVLVILVGAIIGLGVLLLRRSNEIDFEDDEEEDEEYDDSFDSELDEAYDEALEESVWEDETPRGKPVPPKAVQSDLDARKSKRRAPRPPPDAREEEAPKKRTAKRRVRSKPAEEKEAPKRRAAKRARKSKPEDVDLRDLMTPEETEESTDESTDEETAMDDALRKMLG